MQAVDHTENHRRLKRFIEKETDTLVGALRLYVMRGNVAREMPVEVAALELLNDVTVEALDHAGRFDPDRQPMAWLLGIAANLIRQRQAAFTRREWREPLVGDVIPADGETLSEEELFDRLAALAPGSPGDDIESREEVAVLLAGLSDSDRDIVRLAILNGMNGESVANELEITPGAARVRLHRALERLRRNLASQPKDG